MVLTISIPSDAEDRHRQRARAEGKDIGQYVEQLNSKKLQASLSLVEITEPIAGAVDASRRIR
ncbi:MAG: hypothetical protein WD768_22005 [Phycisphaeraceae bacterium]